MQDFYCEYALKNIDALDVVYQSDSVLAFYHTKPLYEQHIVVIPKAHLVSILDVSDKELFGEMLSVAQSIFNDWGDEAVQKGAKIISNFGAFQDSKHLHFHVVLGSKIIYD